MPTRSPSPLTLFGLRLDVAKVAALAEASFQADFTAGVGPAKGSWGANVIDTGGAVAANPMLYWFTSPEELVAFLAGSLCAALGDEAEGTPTDRASALCAAIREATDVSTLVEVCGDWFGWSELTWVGSFDDLYAGDSGVAEEARGRFEEFLEDADRGPIEGEAAQRQCFLDWLQGHGEGGGETGVL